MSKVKTDEGTQETQFHLLRCSTNLDGPTEGFKEIDEQIIAQVSIGILRIDQVTPMNIIS